MVDEHVRLIAKVARMYHEQDLRQQDIADTLAISQARVSRLLKEAAERGVVRSIVEIPEGVYADLEDRLESTLGLQQAIVADADGSQTPERALSIPAAAYLQATVTTDAVIGVSTWSSSLIAMVDAMTTKPAASVRGASKVLQMFGGIGSPDVQFEATRLTNELARRTGARAVFVPAPAVAGSSEAARALRGDADVAAVIAQWPEITVSLVGIGQLQPSALLASSGNAMTEQEREELRSRGAVGDVCLRYFNADGVDIDSTFDARVIGMTAAEIRSVTRRIAVAGGPAKVDAIRAAARGGWVNVLVTDVQTAQALIG